MEEDPEGTVHIAFDESFEPLTCVGATVADTEYTRLNDSISTLYAELTSYSWLDDLKSFKKFAKDGFHASGDPDEVSTRFIHFLAQSSGYSTSIFFSEERTRHKNRVAVLLYRDLIRTLLQKYARRPLIHLYFEQNDELDPYFQSIVASAMKDVRRPKPEVSVQVHSKMDPPLSAICDYTMLTFARWYAGGYRGSQPQAQDPRVSTWRNFNALRNSISVVRSLESGTLTRRALPFEALI